MLLINYLAKINTTKRVLFQNHIPHISPKPCYLIRGLWEGVVGGGNVW